ncbi:MAG: transposase [Nanoarchaeota archaeon]|nr:transposase [Nanoarchaeota archaeon]
MKFHPHLHILTNLNVVFNYKFNRIWRNIILKNLKINSNRYYYGYYVWSDNKTINLKQLSKYIGRYVRHPAIANGRIRFYDKNVITFYFKDNQDKMFLINKSIDNFITSLVQHIPKKQFKMIRYYGDYARNKKVVC